MRLFSGGKDSGVLLNLCIDYIRRNRLNRKLCVFHMDYEIQYSMTIDYVDRVLEANKDILEVYRVCVPFRVTTCTSMYQSYWRPWQEDLEDIWVRKMPKGCLTKETFPFYTPEMWDYEFQMHFAKWLHEKKDGVRACFLIGIRTQESFNRWRSIHLNRKYQMYHNYRWTSKIGNDIFNAYPIMIGRRRISGRPMANSALTITICMTYIIKPESISNASVWQALFFVRHKRA